MSEAENAIVVKDLHKTFRLPHEQHSGLKQVIVNFSKRKKGYENQHVLKGVSFEIKKGEFFGIVGRNGSGKSTLLKLLAGIYAPDTGLVQINGSLTPFIELGVGFNPELTGRENVFLNGALLGFSRAEMEVMYDDIVEFAELSRFMDQKLKNYSSGMQVRLAFSIAIRAESDILLLDEVLAVGDEAFQRKCNDYFKTLKNNGKTVVLVTHSMDNVRKYCNKAMMLHNGKVVAYGSPDDIANEYSIENIELNGAAGSEHEDKSVVSGLKIELINGRLINQDSDIKLKISYKLSSEIPTKVCVSFQDLDKNTPLLDADSPVVKGIDIKKVFNAKVSSINDSNIKISVSVRDQDNNILYFLPDTQSPVVTLRRTDYPDASDRPTWAVLFDRGSWE